LAGKWHAKESNNLAARAGARKKTPPSLSRNAAGDHPATRACPTRGWRINQNDIAGHDNSILGTSIPDRVSARYRAAADRATRTPLARGLAAAHDENQWPLKAPAKFGGKQ
jgi:hypothetical protein